MRLLTGFRMTVSYLEALVGIALSFSILMGVAWMGQQRTGNSGRVDTIKTRGVGSIPLAFAIFVAARFPQASLPLHNGAVT
jgi:steroid 5-alpha reductase family enzyme